MAKKSFWCKRRAAADISSPPPRRKAPSETTEGVELLESERRSFPRSPLPLLLPPYAQQGVVQKYREHQHVRTQERVVPHTSTARTSCVPTSKGKSSSATHKQHVDKHTDTDTQTKTHTHTLTHTHTTQKIARTDEPWCWRTIFLHRAHLTCRTRTSASADPQTRWVLC